ncbi:helix-turn-helix domain-containing protein [Paenibacillus massiliensis]|uniref:helix-turn-helix domain-containing protein n=1 Tax=Paenibacillus massiliensis TaxID=225917 RepID=UPI0004729AB6|nr:helix-turn-helix transcriptional regulator [Paenibacillus massiliensis]
MSELRQQIGTRIRAMRNAKGLTQQKLADFAGLDYRYIGALERGERNFSIDTLEKVLVALDVTISELMVSEDNSCDELKQRTVNEFIIGTSNLNDEQLKSVQKINTEVFKLFK